MIKFSAVKMENTVGKYCIVPSCSNTSYKTPEKLFFYVPEDPTLRKEWMTVVKRVVSLSPKTKAHCCEDHFDVENDMENYIRYKLVGGKLKLKKGVVPHKFACQKQSFETPERSDVGKLKNAKPTTSSSECIASTSHDVAEDMSELDRFKRRLVRSVSRMLLRESRPPEEVWETLRKGTGKDCKELWTRMRALTLKKLARLLAADDYPSKVPSVARMTPTDWLMFDLALAHEDIDVIDQNNKLGKHADKSSPLWALMRLAITFNVDSLSGPRLAAVWVSIARNYNSSGRECSPMLLQKRWYQLKETSRQKFYVFWQEWKGKYDNTACMKFAPTRVQAVVAKCNPHLITQPFSKWEELKTQGKVVLAEQMQAIIRDANKSQNPEKDAEADKEPEVILMEPKIPTIDLGADSDDEVNTKIDTQTEKANNTTQKGNTPHENVTEDNTQIRPNTEKDIKPTILISQHVDTIVRVKPEPLEQDCLANIQIGQATHVPTEEVDNDNDPKHEEVKTEVYDDITVTETVLQKPVETDFVQPNTVKIVVENKACDKEKNVEDDIFSKDVIETNVMLENSDDEDDIITYDKDKSPERAATNDVTRSKEVEAGKVQKESTAELVFVDDGIEMDEGDDGEYLDGSVQLDSKNDQLNDTKALKRHDTSEDENLAKIDLKLIMKPVIYTVKLDQMVTLKDKPYDSVESKGIIDAILNESKPVTKLIEIQPEQNTSVASLANDDKHMSDDIIKLAPPIEITSEKNTSVNNDDKLKREEIVKLAPIGIQLNPQSMEVDIKSEELTTEVQELEAIKIVQKVSEERDDSESDEDVERISPKAAMFRKPKVKEYSPIQLCKNPDFNTRLKRLNVMFYAYETNRKYLKEIKPMTIDLAKTFESKLVNNTIFLKSEGPKLKIERDIEHNSHTTDEIANDDPRTPIAEASAPENQTPIDIQFTVGEDTKPTMSPAVVKHSTSPNLSVKCVQSANNPNVKYLEVAMNFDQYEDKEPIIHETNTIKANSLWSLPNKLVTQKKNIEIERVKSVTTNVDVENSIKSLPEKLDTHAKPVESLTDKPTPESFIGNDATTSTNVAPANSYTAIPIRDTDSVGSVIESVISSAMNPQPPRKTIAKKKVTQTSIPWYRPIRPQRPQWCDRSKKSIIAADTLLTIDTLNKMLNLCLTEDGAPVPVLVSNVKKKYRKIPAIPKTDKQYCCWIKELYSTKQFGKLRAHPCFDKQNECTCCCRRNFGKDPSENVTTDNKGTNTDKETVEEPKGKAATTSTEDKVETITLEDNDIVVVDNTNVESVDNDDLSNDKADSLENRELSTSDEVSVDVESVPKRRTKKSKTDKVSKNDETNKTNTEKVPKKRIPRAPKAHKKTIFYTGDIESMQEISNEVVTKITPTDPDADAEEVDITSVDPSPPLAPPIVTKIVPAWQELTLPPQITPPPPPPLFKITIKPPITNLTQINTFTASEPKDIPILTDAPQNQASPTKPPVCIELSDDDGDVDYQPPRYAMPAEAKKGRRGRPRKTPLPTAPRVMMVRETDCCIPKLIKDSANRQNLDVLRKFSGVSPFQVGRNKILLTTALITADMFDSPLTNIKVTASVTAPLVALPFGIRFAATQSGELSCFVDLKLFDMRKFKHLPAIVERVRNQLNCHKIPIIYSADTDEDVNNIIKKLAELQNTKPDIIAEVDVSNEVTINETTNINTEEDIKDNDVVDLAETTDINADKGSSEPSDNPAKESNCTEDNVPKIDQDKSQSPRAIVEIDDDTGETRDITLDKDQTEIIRENPGEQENQVPSESVKPILKIKDFAAVKEDDATTTKKTILSDLMEMSGISADDTLPEPLVPEPPLAPDSTPAQAPPAFKPSVTEQHINNDLNNEPTDKVVYQAIQGVIQLTPVTSVEVLKYARNEKAKFFRLDLQHGTIVPTEVSIIQKDKVKKLPKNAVVVDLTKVNKEIVEVHSKGQNARHVHVLTSSLSLAKKPAIFQKRKPDHKTYLEQLRNIWKNSQKVKLKVPPQVTDPPNHTVPRQVQKQPRKEKISTRIDMVDSDVPMEEEFLDSSDEASQQSGETPQVKEKAPEKRPMLFDSSDSDDEPLAKKVTRKNDSVTQELKTNKANDNTQKENDNTDKGNDNTNKSDDEVEDEEQEGEGPLSIEGLMDEIMSDDEDFILGT